MRQSKVPTKSPSVGPRPESGGWGCGLSCTPTSASPPAAAVVVLVVPVAQRPVFGRWALRRVPKERPVQCFSPTKAPARVSVRVDFFFDEAVCGVRCADHVLRTAYCAARGVSAETKPCLVCILPVLFPIQATTKGVSPIRPAESAWAHLILVVTSRLAATLSSVSRAGRDQVGRCATRLEPSQRKLSLSSRDDPNYKGIMRLRAQLADTL